MGHTWLDPLGGHLSVNNGSDLSAFGGLAGAPFVLALTEAIKRMVPGMAPRWTPLVAIAVGVVVNLAIAYADGTSMVGAIVLGVASACMAIGLYSGSRSVIGPNQSKEGAETRENGSKAELRRA